MSSTEIPADVERYFDALDPARRGILRPVFDVIRAAMPQGYRLEMGYGMPGWVIPLETYPNTYNGQPLSYAGLAAQKRYNSIYLMALYSDPEADAAFRAAWAATGRKLNMGKSCLRFKTLADLDLDLIAETIASVPVERFLATYERIKPGA